MFMGKLEKLLVKLLFGGSDKNFRFDDLVKILLSLGFEERVNGSHHIFVKEDIPDIVNIQSIGDKAKPYQVKQVRDVIIKFKLWQNGTSVE